MNALTPIRTDIYIASFDVDWGHLGRTPNHVPEHNMLTDYMDALDHVLEHVMSLGDMCKGFEVLHASGIDPLNDVTEQIADAIVMTAADPDNLPSIILTTAGHEVPCDYCGYEMCRCDDAYDNHIADLEAAE